MKIVILDRNTVTNGDVSFAEIEALGEVTYFDVLLPEELVNAIGDAEVVICNKAYLDREIIEACPRLRYIGLFATGYSCLQCARLFHRGRCTAYVFDDSCAFGKLLRLYKLDESRRLDKVSDVFLFPVSAS